MLLLCNSFVSEMWWCLVLPCDLMATESGRSVGSHVRAEPKNPQRAQTVSFQTTNTALWAKASLLRLGRADMVDVQGRHRPLIRTDVPPHIHKRVTTVAGSSAACLLVPALFDSDGAWKPGDIRGCNNISALRQVFKSGTRLVIITTFALFIWL